MFYNIYILSVLNQNWQYVIHVNFSNSPTFSWDTVIAVYRTSVCTLIIYLSPGKYQPNLEGLDKFEGKKVHTHDYKEHRGYEGKKVVVVGIGNSGGDAAVELSQIADQVKYAYKCMWKLWLQHFIIVDRICLSFYQYSHTIGQLGYHIHTLCIVYPFKAPWMKIRLSSTTFKTKLCGFLISHILFFDQATTELW